jgi:hypothetical protein
MDSFWGILLEHFKSRCAWIFVPTLLIFFALVLLSQFLDSLLSNNLPDISSEDVIRFSLYGMPAVAGGCRDFGRWNWQSDSPQPRAPLQTIRIFVLVA